MRSLLDFVERVCGRQSRETIFEPLVADWQREWREAPASTWAHARMWIALRWSLGFLVALIGCATRHAVSADGPMWRSGIVVFAIAIAVSIAAETILMRLTTSPDYTWDLMLIGALRFTGLAALAAAMLPAMFLLRRDPRATRATAAGYTALGVFLIALAVIAQPSLENYQLSFGQTERMYQRARALDLADQYQYPRTVEERRTRYEQYTAMQAQAIATRQVRTPWLSLRRSTAPPMVIVFGAIGWGLGALMRPTLTRAAMWWFVAWLPMIEGRLSDVFDLPHPQPDWWVLPAVASIAALSLMYSRHRGAVRLKADAPPRL